LQATFTKCRDLPKFISVNPAEVNYMTNKMNENNE